MSLENYFDAFSEYLATEDATKLLPYLEQNTNLDYLKIYRNGAIKSGLDALAANFPTAKRLMGNEPFSEIGRQYVLQEWPDNSCLSSYGSSFPHFIDEQIENTPKYSVDFATLDRTWLDALFAKNENPISGDAIAEIIQNKPDTEIKLLSSVKIITLKEPSLPEWIKLKFNLNDIEHENYNSTSIIMWRRQGVVYYRALSAFEHAFIASISTTGSLIKSAEVALETDQAGDISKLFSSLISADVFAIP